ncbi:hypothetical protein [Pararoseomonas baculiformis]|uniref:hypothetical protein n=1 Tax=Pararoseomonas baculiformis TaxID=2820812 RepID=UPI001AE0B01D|nr:hypothetical protein [Pararoseomonas baculiformis]
MDAELGAAAARSRIRLARQPARAAGLDALLATRTLHAARHGRLASCVASRLAARMARSAGRPRAA